MDQRQLRAVALVFPALLISAGLVALLLMPPEAPSVDGIAAEPSLAPLLSIDDTYTAGGPATSGGQPVRLSSVVAGELALPTGRVVAADVYFSSDAPFVRTVPSGRYPVSLLRTAEGPAFGSIAAAMVRFAPGDPVSWELAVVADQDPGELHPGEFYGYGVDSGTGCFASPEAVAAIGSGPGSEDYSEAVHNGMYPSDDVADWNHSVEVVVEEGSGANVIGFSSGFGDGVYPSWFGLDADGEAIVLLTDFGILEPSA